MYKVWYKFLFEAQKSSILTPPNGINITQPGFYKKEYFATLKNIFVGNMPDDFKKFIEEYFVSKTAGQQTQPTAKSFDNNINTVVQYLIKMCSDIVNVKNTGLLTKKHLSPQSLEAYKQLLRNYFQIKDENSINFLIEEIKKFIENENKQLKIYLTILPEDQIGEFDPTYRDRIYVSLYFVLKDYIEKQFDISASRFINTFSHEFSHMIDLKIKRFIIESIKKNKIKSSNIKKQKGFSSYTFYQNLEDDIGEMLKTFYKEINERPENIEYLKSEYDLDEEDVNTFKDKLKYFIDAPEIYVRMKQLQQIINKGQEFSKAEQVKNVIESGILEKSYPDVNKLIQMLDLKNPNNLQKFTNILNTIAKVEQNKISGQEKQYA